METTQTPWDNNSARFDFMLVNYASAARGLARMLVKAEASGKKVGGYTLAELRAGVADYERLSQATDAEIRAHLGVQSERMAARRIALR